MHGAGAAAAREHHHVMLGRVHGVADQVASLVPEEGGLQRGDAGSGVRVAVAGQHLVQDVVLDELQRPARRRVVAVHHFPPAERAAEARVLPNDVVINIFDQLGGIFAFLRAAMTNLGSP